MNSWLLSGTSKISVAPGSLFLTVSNQIAALVSSLVLPILPYVLSELSSLTAPAHSLAHPRCCQQIPAIVSAGNTQQISLLNGQHQPPISLMSPQRLLEPSPDSCKWKTICTHSQDESFCFNRLSFCWHCHRHGCLLCLLTICWQNAFPGPADHHEVRCRKEEGEELPLPGGAR